jgi:hypothetical protein
MSRLQLSPAPGQSEWIECCLIHQYLQLYLQMQLRMQLRMQLQLQLQLQRHLSLPVLPLPQHLLLLLPLLGAR